MKKQSRAEAHERPYPSIKVFKSPDEDHVQRQYTEWMEDNQHYIKRSRCLPIQACSHEVHSAHSSHTQTLYVLTVEYELESDQPKSRCDD
jgi:hypothetical protein